MDTDPQYTSVPLGDLVVDLYWSVIDGRTECVGVRLRTWNEDDDVTEVEPRAVRTKDLRDLNLASMIVTERSLIARESLRSLRRAEGWSPTGHPDIDRRTADYLEGAEPMREQWEREEAKDAPKRVGRPTMYGPDHYREVARVYAQAWRDGAHPTQAVADHFTTSRSAAAKWVAKARNEYGFLEPVRPSNDEREDDR